MLLSRDLGSHKCVSGVAPLVNSVCLFHCVCFPCETFVVWCETYAPFALSSLDAFISLVGSVGGMVDQI